jgi:hypothetical protein
MKNRGFIALTLVLSVAGTLLALVLISSIDSASFFDQAMKKEYRAMNYYYAYDCLDQAILALSHDYFFEPSTPIEIPEFHCSILSVQKDGDLRTITAVGNYMKALVYRKVTVRLGVHGVEVVEF